MANPAVHNPKDYQVVEFHNPTDFTFTPEMGCMFDGRPIFGITGAPGINSGESMTLPYHVGHLLAKNLAKAVMVRQAPMDNASSIALGASVTPLWSTERMEQLKNSYLKDLYTETRPIQETETDRLMRKVEELTRIVLAQQANNSGQPATPVAPAPVTEATPTVAPAPVAGPIASPYKDKQEVITELEVRGIKHDKRKSRDDLEVLLKTPLVVPTAPEVATVA